MSRKSPGSRDKSSDVTGRVLRPGDTVVWASTHAPYPLVVARVRSFTDAGRVRVEVVRSSHPPNPVPGEVHTVDNRRCVLVTG